MVRLAASNLAPYAAFTCYNSPYAAHDDASAIDLYPGTRQAPSPVAGEVVAVDRVRAPWRPYARAFDHVIAIDTGRGRAPIPAGDGAAGAVARILHVDPTVTVGDAVDVGDPLGTLLRAGFFAPWVANHLHVGFRPPGADLLRAGGSLPLALDTTVEGVPWDGTGRVSATGRTFIELEAAMAPAPDTDWVGIASDDGSVLDGGLPHYRFGGLVERLLGERSGVHGTHDVGLLGTTVGVAIGPTIEWADVSIDVDGIPFIGLSLFCARPDAFRIKLVCREHPFSVGESVSVGVRRSDDPD